MASSVGGESGLLRQHWGELSQRGGGRLDPVLRFVHAVDWTEPWLIGLIAFHVALVMAVLATRKQGNTQAVLFFGALTSVFFAGRLNSFLLRNWRSLAGQPYFDSHGVFMSTVWSGPVLLISSLILVNSMVTLAQMVIEWQRAELKHKAQIAREKTE